MGTGALFDFFCLASAEAAILIFLGSPGYLCVPCVPGGWGQPGRGGSPYLGGDCRLRPALTERGPRCNAASCGEGPGSWSDGRWPAFQSGEGRLREGAFAGGAEDAQAPRKQTAVWQLQEGQRGEGGCRGGRGEGPRGLGSLMRTWARASVSFQ